MRKKRTLLTILFSVLMIALPVSAFASNGWFTLENNTGHTIAIANFADKAVTSTDEMYISLQERDASGNYIEMHEIRFADYNSPFGNYMIDKIVLSTASKEIRATGFVLEAKLYTDENCTQEITNETNKLTSDNNGLSVGGTNIDNNYLKIDKSVINKIKDEFGQPYRGEAYMVFTAEKYLYDYVDGNGATKEEKQTLTLKTPIVIADRVIDEYSDFAAIKQYAFAASMDGTAPDGTVYNRIWKDGYDKGLVNGYEHMYVGYYVLSKDVDCGGNHTGIGYWSATNTADTTDAAGAVYGNCGTVVNSVFDGRGYALLNTNIKEHASGLFSVMANCTVKNLTVLNATLDNNGSVIASAMSDKREDSASFPDAVEVIIENQLPNFNWRYTDANKTAKTDTNLIENVYVYGTLNDRGETHTPRALIAGKANWGTIRNCVAVLDNHNLVAGPDYSGITKSNYSTYAPTGTLNSKASSSGILLAYTSYRTVVQDCIGINLKVGTYNYGWLPAINDYYVARKLNGATTETAAAALSSRLRYPNKASDLQDVDHMSFGGWYEHTPEEAGVILNSSQNVRRVFGIMGWESYAKWYYRMQTAGRFNQGGDCYNLYNFIRNLDDKGNERCIQWKAYVNIDSDPDRRKNDVVDCKVPITLNSTVRNYFKNNVSAAKITTVNGETTVERNAFINKTPFADEPGFIANSAASYDINGGSESTYRDYYTLYTGEEINGDAGMEGVANYTKIGYNDIGYLRVNQWVSASGTLSGAHNVKIEEIYRDYIKDANQPKQLDHNKWNYYKTDDGKGRGKVPFISTNGRVIEFDGVNRGASAIVRARSMLDLGADGIFIDTPAGEDDILSVFVLEDCRNTGDMVTFNGTTYVDTQDETIIRYEDPNNTKSTPYYQNFVTIDFRKDYIVPTGAPGIDTAYHTSLEVWRYGIDTITVTGVEFEIPSDLDPAAANAGQKVSLDFEWQDEKLVVYDKADRKSRYGASGLYLYNTDYVSNSGNPRYLYITAQHHLDGAANDSAVKDALVKFKVPITLCTKIFTNQQQITAFYDYALMENYYNRGNGKTTGEITANKITAWSNADRIAGVKPTISGTLKINVGQLLYQLNYGGYYTLANDIDMKGKTFERYWGWDVTTWCLNGNYLYLIDGVWYTSTSSYGGVDLWGNLSDGFQNGWSTSTDVLDTGFIGTFDGRGYIINDIQTWGVQGWFGNLGIKGTVKNLTFTNATLANSASLLSQYQSGRYENIYVHIKSVGYGTSNNPVSVFSASSRGSKAVNLCNFIQVDEHATVDPAVRALEANNDTNKTGIDHGVEWTSSYASIVGQTGGYANMNGLFAVGGGITFVANSQSPCWFQCGDIGKAHGCTCTENGHPNDAIIASAPRRTSSNTIAGLNIGGGVLISTLTNNKTYHYKLNGVQKSGNFNTYFNDIWSSSFWTLDSDGLPIPKRLKENTSQTAIKFQDVAIGETTNIGFADEYYSGLVDKNSYTIASHTGDSSLDSEISIDAVGNITLSNNVPEGTVINVRARINTDQYVTITVKAAKIETIEIEDILIDKATSSYTLDLANLQCTDGTTKEIELPIAVRDMYINGLRCISGTHFSIDANNPQKVIISNEAYLDYKQTFICTIKNGNPEKLTRIQGTVYFYDMLIKDADDLDAFLPMAQKKLGGVANKTWLGTYLLANDIDYNINPFDAEARKYGFKSNAGGDTRYTGGAYGFGGVFDGRGYSINGLIISLAGGAFLGQLAEPGLICNTNFINARLTTSRASLITSGTAAAGTIQDCYMHVFAEASCGIITSDNYAQMRIRRCIIEVAQTEGSSKHCLQDHYNPDYGTYDETYIVGNVDISRNFGTKGSYPDEFAIYPSWDDFLTGTATECSDHKRYYEDRNGDGVREYYEEPSNYSGCSHAPTRTNWADNSEGYWTEKNGIPVPTKLLEEHNNRPNANFVPPTTIITENTTKRLEIFNDCYAIFEVDEVGKAAGATISNHYLTVPIGCPNFKILVKSYLKSEQEVTEHLVYITDIRNETATQLDDLYMTDESDEIVVKLHDTLYKASVGVDEHDKVVFQSDMVRIETDFHGSKQLINFEYYDAGYEQDGYSHGKVLVLNKHDLAGITYGEVRLYATFYVYTADTTFDVNGNILTGDFIKVVNITVPFNLITAKIGTANDLDKFWDYVFTPENSESYDGQITSYGGYFVLTDNIVYNKEWANTKFNWTEERQNAGGWDETVGFKGVIDGKGYVIEGLSFNSAVTNGMFGCINHYSTIKNIAFVKSSLKANQSLFASKGGGKFENIYVQLDYIKYGMSNNGTGVFIGSPGGTPSSRLYLNKVFVEISPANGTLASDYFTQDSLYTQTASPSTLYYTYSGALGTMRPSQIHNTLVINRGFADYVAIPADNSFKFPSNFDNTYNLANRVNGSRSDMAGLTKDIITSKLESLGSSSYSFTHRFTTDANSQGGVVPAPTYATKKDPNDASKTIANLDSAFIQKFTSDSVWTTDAYGLPIFKQLAFNGESLDIGIVSAGGSYTLALSNKVISRITTWTLPAGAPSGVSISNGKLVIADTVAKGTSISVTATTIYGSKTFTFTVA